MIGVDFQRIQLNIGGLELLEPNAFIGDTLIFGIALYCFMKVPKTSLFNRYWKMFYLVFGISFLLGGFGHLFFNYCGLWGKAPSWLLGIVAAFCVEQPMILLWVNPNQKRKILLASKIKMVLFLILEIGYLLNFPSEQDHAIFLLIPTVNSIIGLGITLCYLGYYYQRKLESNFRYFWIGSLFLLPNVAVQGLKINLNPWFDRNDLSHLLLLIGVVIYFVGVIKLSEFNAHKLNLKA